MVNKEILDLTGWFYQRIGTCEFFIMTEQGNFIWLHPAWKRGNNTICKTNKKFREWEQGGAYHLVGSYKLEDYIGIDAIWKE